MKKGVLLACSACIIWGLHPIYWKLLQHVPSVEILSHLILWSLIFFIVLIYFRNEWKELVNKLIEHKKRSILYVPVLLIGANWGMYIWAVNSGYVIETSLGYFISPILSVLLGVFILKETLSKVQWLAVTIAVMGVLIMTFLYGQLPWISLFLAATWGIYGLLRKKSPLNAIEGLTLETAVLIIPVIVYFIYLSKNGTGSFLTNNYTSILLIGTGIISGFPLLLFISGARIIKLSLIGILQYICPTIILILGVFVFREELTEPKIIGFVFIWIALILYTLEGTFNMRRGNRAVS
jgi:chloramphenicol-sensitive protein RarD